MTFTHWDGPPIDGQQAEYPGIDVENDRMRASQVGITIALVPITNPWLSTWKGL